MFQVLELEILTGQTDSPFHSEHMKENIIGDERLDISAFKVELTEFVEDGLVDNLKKSTDEIGAAWNNSTETVAEPLKTQFCNQDNSKNVAMSMGNDEAMKADDMNDIIDHNKDFFEGFESASGGDDEDMVSYAQL